MEHEQTLNDFEATITPGHGVALRADGVVMVVVPSDGQTAMTTALIELVQTASAGQLLSGRRLARRLAALLGAAENDEVPPFALVADEPAGSVVVFVYGPLRVDIGGAETISVDGALSATWADRLVAQPVQSIRLGSPDGITDVGLDRRYTLREGVVPAAGIHLVTHPADGRVQYGPIPDSVEQVVPPPPSFEVDVDASIDAPEPQPSAGRDSDDPTREAPVHVGAAANVVALTDASDPDWRTPLDTDDRLVVDERLDDGELVEGIMCSREHINDPTASYCSSCGISMVHRTHNLVVGRRPPLGVFVFDDGSIYSLDSGYVIGREPDGDPKVVNGTFRALVIDDPERRISRIHAEVVLDGWDVKVIDRGSTNGTFVFDRVQDRWQQLIAEHPETLGPSTRLAFGSRTCVYETPHRAPIKGSPIDHADPRRGAR